MDRLIFLRISTTYEVKENADFPEMQILTEDFYLGAGVILLSPFSWGPYYKGISATRLIAKGIE
jgi:hypothetical protein